MWSGGVGGVAMVWQEGAELQTGVGGMSYRYAGLSHRVLYMCTFVARLITSTHSVVSLTVFMAQLAVLRTFAASLAK